MITRRLVHCAVPLDETSRWATLLAVTANLPAASAEFKLSITRALADQLAESLDRLRPAALTTEQLVMLQPRPGVYELFLHERRVYVGKSSKNILARLGNHLRKLSGRSNIELTDMSFQCLYVDEDLEAASPEKLLIKKYRDQGGAPWNTNGFGNKDPGRNRDHSLVKANHFDAKYPINLDLRIEALEPGPRPVKAYLQAVKKELPFNLRFDTRSPRSKEDYGGTTAVVSCGDQAVRDLIRAAVEALPEGWQATALPGYVILYPENAIYESAHALWRKQDAVVSEISGASRLDEAGTIEEELGDEE